MKRLLIASLLVSTSSMAHDCDIDFKGQMSFKQGVLTLTPEQQPALILNGQNAELGSRSLDLNSSQQALLNNYHQQMETFIPKVGNIASEAVSLAQEGISLAFGELLGEDSEAVQKLTDQIGDIGEKVKGQFFLDDGSVQFDSHQFEDGNFLSSEFEQELEQTIEQIVQSSMGTFMVALGKQMLASGGDMQNFEQRMENFGQSIEQQMEQRTAKIEREAATLCSEMLELDKLENQIARTIPQLSELDMIRVKSSNMAM